MNELTNLDIEDIEEISGLPFESVSDTKVPKAKVITAWVYVQKRKTEPKFTLEDAKAMSRQESWDFLDSLVATLSETS